MIAEQFKDRYYINTDSLFREYGVIVERGGYAELTKEPKRKNMYSHSWLDQNGTERFINNKFESRNVTLIFTFIAENLTDYKTNKNALFTLLRNGVIVLGVETLNLEWELLYENETNVELFISDEVIARHTLTFIDDKVFPDTLQI